MATLLRPVDPKAPSRGAGAPHSGDEIASQTFLMGLAHDFRQALTVIGGTAHLTERWVGASTIPLDTVFTALRDIQNAADRMSLQIAELEDFAMVEPDRAPALERRPVDLIAMAREAVARHAGISDRHRFAVTVRNARGGSIVGYWDAGKLERALDNLVGNAIKFSPDGGKITLNVGREGAPTIDGTDADVAVLQVRDQGMGIPARDLPHVFECFRRAENATSAIPGTGVGLAVVQQIIHQHGGTLEAASKLGCGSTFTLRLPLLPP